MDEGRVGLIEAVSDWLKLLALIVLVAEATLLLAMNMTKEESLIYDFYPVMMLLFLGVVVGGFFYDRYLQSKEAKGPHFRVDDTPSLDEGSLSEELDNRFNGIRKRVQEATERDIPVINKEIAHELNELAIHAKDWRQGQVQTPASRYNTVLLDLYKSARSSIVSTTIKEYLQGWTEDLMEQMVRASEASEASQVVRIFIFGDWSEIDEQAIRIIERFEDADGITAKVYIDSADNSFTFPTDYSRDFVVFDDGEAIGVTQSYGPGNLSARWYFKDSERKEKFTAICRNLLRGSKDAAEILDWWSRERQRVNKSD